MIPCFGQRDWSGGEIAGIVRVVYGSAASEAQVRLFHATTEGYRQEITEDAYFERLREIYNLRNPHAQIGRDALIDD